MKVNRAKMLLKKKGEFAPLCGGAAALTGSVPSAATAGAEGRGSLGLTVAMATVSSRNLEILSEVKILRLYAAKTKTNSFHHCYAYPA